MVQCLLQLIFLPNFFCGRGQTFIFRLPEFLSWRWLYPKCFVQPSILCSKCRVFEKTWLFFFFFFLQDGGCTCPGDVSKAFGKWLFNIILANFIFGILWSPHPFQKKKIYKTFWSKFWFSCIHLVEHAFFLTLFHVWPQVLVLILSWWEACLLAMISLVSKAGPLIIAELDRIFNSYLKEEKFVNIISKFGKSKCFKDSHQQITKFKNSKKFEGFLSYEIFVR